MATEKFKEEIKALLKAMCKAKMPFLINIEDGGELICGINGKPYEILIMIVATIFHLADSIDEDASTVAADILKAVIEKEIKDENKKNEDEDDD